MGEPRLTIGLPVYNGARHLSETVDSLLGQTWGDFTLTISDNASTDATEDLCRDFARADGRVRYVRQEVNVGANENYNVVARSCSTEFFRWAAHDDLLAPDYLQECVAALDAQPRAVLGHCEPALVDVDGRPLQRVDGRLVQPDGVVVRDPDPPVAERGLGSDRPSQRFAGVLLHTRWVFEIFGIMRWAALRRTGLQGAFYGTDKVLVAQMSLLGTFVGVPAPLWSRRCHEGATTYLDAVGRTRWSSPGARPVPTSVHMLRGYLHAVHETRLPPLEHARCLAVVAHKVASSPKSHVASDGVAVLKERLRR